MCFLPANTYASLDVKLNTSLKKYSMPVWCSWVMIAQVSIVYLYATIAKFYPGWLDGTFTYNLLEQSITAEGFREVFATKWFALFIAYAGIAFDLLVVPLMLFKRTRTIAFFASLIFHIFNSITLKIGIFPFFALSFAVFFFPPEVIRRLFFRKKPVVFLPASSHEGQSVVRWFFIPYLIIQFLLPLRHHLIKGDVLWTEEGHRLSWRMMLRNRSGYTQFKVKDKDNNIVPYDIDKDLTSKQRNVMGTRPDMIWQMARHIKNDFAKKGIAVAVYAETKVSINEGPYNTLIDPETDLAAAQWNYFFHCPWIVLDENTGNIKD
jgi:hypothetical protein